MSDFSIELSSERITDSRTKKYFSEVILCYNTGCYRSSVVMLWSVVICDILFKMMELRDLYADSIAKGIIRKSKLFVLETNDLQNGNGSLCSW
jgi:hypothetical protein